MDYDTFRDYLRTVERISNMPMGDERTKLRDQLIDRLKIEYGTNDQYVKDLIYSLNRIW